MYTYAITVFENDGTLLINDTFEAEHDDAAKIQGEAMLRAQHYEHKGVRITRSGQLIHFMRCELPAHHTKQR